MQLKVLPIQASSWFDNNCLLKAQFYWTLIFKLYKLDRGVAINRNMQSTSTAMTCKMNSTANQGGKIWILSGCLWSNRSTSCLYRKKLDLYRNVSLTSCPFTIFPLSCSKWTRIQYSRRDHMNRWLLVSSAVSNVCLFLFTMHMPKYHADHTRHNVVFSAYSAHFVVLSLLWIIRLRTENQMFYLFSSLILYPGTQETLSHSVQVDD